MRDRRAMTLVELLAALGLLSVVALGASTWLATTAQTQRAVGARVRFETAARALLERIHEDIMCGDFSADERERIVVENGSLVIETRLIDGGVGAAKRTYSHNERDGTVSVQITSAQRTQMRRLLGDVTAFHCAIKSSEIESNDDRSHRVLTVTIASRLGQRLEREIRTP